MLLWLIFLSFCAVNADELRNVFILWRHGDRAPYANNLKLPKTLWELWPNGLGQLTPVGISQQYNLGAYLRSVYGDFIPAEYNYTHYHLRSSDYDRTLMSAMANAAAFYANSSSPLTFHWRPIPVHTVKDSRETLFANEPCPYLRELTEADYETTEAQERVNQWRSQIATIQSHLPDVRVKDLGHLYDEMVCLQSHNYSLPGWMQLDKSIPAALADLGNYFWQASSASEEKLTLRVGVFLRMMFDHMGRLIKDGHVTVPIDGSPRALAKNHLMAYSAHDTNVAPLMAAFGLAQDGLPQYTATVMMELHGPAFPAPKSQYRFRLLYKNSFRDSAATAMKFQRFCQGQEFCPFEVVEANLEKYFISTGDYVYRCNKRSPRSNSRWITTVLSFLCVVGLVILVGVGLFYYRSRRNNSYVSINEANA